MHISTMYMTVWGNISKKGGFRRAVLWARLIIQSSFIYIYINILVEFDTGVYYDHQCEPM